MSSSRWSSSILSYPSGSESGQRRSTDSTSTNETSTTEFLAAVATEPPREEDWKGYQSKDVVWPAPSTRSLEESDQLPTAEKLREASNIPLLDADGNQLLFKNLYTGRQHLGQRRLVLFIRHWYCRACQDYIKRLQDLIPSVPSSKRSLVQTPTEVVLIGCGHPSLIKSYVQRTGCPYPIYTEPTLRLLKLLGCHRWGGILWGFGKQPAYVGDMGAIEMGFWSLLDRYKSLYRDPLSSEDSSEMSDGSAQVIRRQPSLESGLKKRVSIEGLRSGPIFQVGGEFLFEDDQLVWCHRMKAMRSHTDIETLRRVLDIEDENEGIEDRLESEWLQQETRDHIKREKHALKQLWRTPQQSSNSSVCSKPRARLAMEPITDEDEETILEQQAGKKKSTATPHATLQTVNMPQSIGAQPKRKEAFCRKKPAARMAR